MRVVDQPMYTSIRWLFILTLMVAITANWASAKQGSKGKEVAVKAPEKPQSQTLNDIPLSLLPTLNVGVDSCFVFLEPDPNSLFFGPLKKGERIKRLDADGGWLRVWIPRLRIPGWVRGQKVYVIKDADADEVTLSTEFLTTVHILKKRVNVRERATVRAPIIFKAKQRQEFLLLDEKDGWYEIWIPLLKKKGWVHGSVVVKQRKG